MRNSHGWNLNETYLDCGRHSGPTIFRNDGDVPIMIILAGETPQRVDISPGEEQHHDLPADTPVVALGTVRGGMLVTGKPAPAPEEE